MGEAVDRRDLLRTASLGAVGVGAGALLTAGAAEAGPDSARTGLRGTWTGTITREDGETNRVLFAFGADGLLSFHNTAGDSGTGQWRLTGARTFTCGFRHFVREADAFRGEVRVAYTGVLAADGASFTAEGTGTFIAPDGSTAPPVGVRTTATRYGIDPS
ncbi:hypothetical protein LZ318_36595 [Saccharopolyspora indica]|uniref:hypothetical protein n=1 Tax=Saccharopolyspora indica TaxID=1229659 RepID=UPI0022EA355D|nr:hypothetical protein [Saccharopolyspora indica]MDA3647677.1 hypothetical protein [Saccharopolyspora indica]